MDYTTITIGQIHKAADLIKKQGTKIQDMVQDYGLAAMYQVYSHGNVEPLNRLYKSLPNGMRKTAFALWAVQVGGVKINKDKGSKEHMPLAYDRASEVNMSHAVSTKWHSVKTEKTLDEVAFDIESALERILKAAMKNPKGTTNPELLKRIQAAMVPPTISLDAAEPVQPAPALPVMALPAGLPTQFNAMAMQ